MAEKNAINGNSLRQLQTILKSKEKEMRITFSTLTKREKDILVKTVKLSEEVGELSNDILATLSLQRKSKLNAFSKQNMYEEFADVLLAVMTLANVMRVDLERAFSGKLDKILNVYVKDRK